ncbi:LysR family transcriptional regulator [Vibrio vulnificus]|jgi:DNA-binding transcriptional LysR family regulator|uniref:LysR family transcriptional regulator n=1 Tax=Vibrio vulnificus TaxID=672 RepID=A0A2S3SSE3_VIBVL|nr:LysR family transcriptional regulator [Vibrio vulnificus]ASM99265.1 LysR family transcriptional regulator [Vibrio vulnificus NBRC 15645 = ATCC 27562]AVX02545.1 LysR family transcriptional regulator [Vibrio vulnificus Env1]EGQ7692323.1 LysR family transcriptional regulator [Vibrio vulnificus]EGQ7758428.1 LysR family transcriptional regulator [Vibrio vulnificus]EGQ7831279.1 LysR family transcriptional regulator [Vibrio vulnificus]
MKNTDLNLIPIFVAIFEEQNLSKAAARLDISQPAVSKALARLRDIYDEPLFHRSPSGVEPTSFAVDIYPAMLTAFKNFTSTLSASSEFEAKVSNRIFSIACVSVASYELMPQLLKQIRQHAPNISLEVHPLFTEDYESDLRLQRYDLIIDMAPRGWTTLKVEPIFSERLMVVCCADHPRIADACSVAQFLAEEHVVVSRWHARKSLMSEEDIADLAQRKIVYRASGALEMLPVIHGSEYIGMLPESTINAFAGTYNIKAVSLPFEHDIYDLCAIWHPSRSSESAHQWLRNQLKAAVKVLKR